MSRSGYYKNLSSKNIQREKDNFLIKEIKRIHEETNQIYGYRRLKIALERSLGVIINNKRIQRIQKEYDLHAKIRRRRVKSPGIIFNKEVPKENILNRNFSADKPNRKWVTDITYIQKGKNKLYMSAIMDLYNREIISYKISDTMDLPFVINTFKEAFRKYKYRNILIHSDQGGHYKSPQFINLLERNDAVQSMSRRGNCYDNASMENFFGHFKSELIYRLKPLKKVELKKAIKNYIDFYNTKRIQTKIKMAPIEYRNHLPYTA